MDYEIDLAPKSAKKFVEVMNTCTQKATRISKPRPGSGQRGGRGSATIRTPREEVAAIRSWAREQGMEVSERGRVSQAIKDAYDQAHSS